MKTYAKAIVALTAMISFSVVNAQEQFKNLIITNITPELSVYPCGDRHEAQVIIRCQEPFDLVLSSNTDTKLDLTVTTEGPEKVYSIVFKTKEEGTSFKGRQLTVVAEGFKKHYIPLNLSDKEKLEFMVTDPYSKLRSLFYTATEAGVSLMSEGMYDAAIDQFNIAKQCPEFPETPNHLDEYIEKCDSLKIWTAKAAAYSANEDYFNARLIYMKMMTENPSCNLIRNLYSDANENYNRVSKHDIDVAQAYFESKRYEEARELYEHAIAQNNPQSALAGTNLALIQLKRYKQDNHTRSVSYIYNKDCNIGIMFAGLKPDKSGGYFSFGFEKGCIDLLSGNLDPITTDFKPSEPMYQAMISAGWTMRLYTQSDKIYIPKVWMLLSPFGYSIGGFYSKIEVTDENNNKTFDEDYHLMHVLAPEVGIAIRMWRVILSYRFQYRYVINKQTPTSDNLGNAKNLFGIGFCW